MIIVSLSYGTLGIVMTLLPYILVDPVFLCTNDKGLVY